MTKANWNHNQIRKWKVFSILKSDAIQAIIQSKIVSDVKYKNFFLNLNFVKHVLANTVRNILFYNKKDLIIQNKQQNMYLKKIFILEGIVIYNRVKHNGFFL